MLPAHEHGGGTESAGYKAEPLCQQRAIAVCGWKFAVWARHFVAAESETARVKPG